MAVGKSGENVIANNIVIKIGDPVVAEQSKVAKYYNENLKDCSYLLPKLSMENSFAWAQYTLRHEKRDMIIKFLNSKGCTVYLKIRVEEILRRINLNKKRPIIYNNQLTLKKHGITGPHVVS